MSPDLNIVQKAVKNAWTSMFGILNFYDHHINTIILTIVTDSDKSVWNNMAGKWAFPILLPCRDLSQLTQFFFH